MVRHPYKGQNSPIGSTDRLFQTVIHTLIVTLGVDRIHVGQSLFRLTQPDRLAKSIKKSG